jgi:hypothetical protein
MPSLLASDGGSCYEELSKGCACFKKGDDQFCHVPCATACSPLLDIGLRKHVLDSARPQLAEIRLMKPLRLPTDSCGVSNWKN